MIRRILTRCAVVQKKNCRRSRRTDGRKRVPAKRKLEAQRLVHELQVHQIELEMQNDELRRALSEIEESRARYLNLYDFSPIGYFTFDQKGRIEAVNLTGTSLLGMERQSLIKAPFPGFLHRDSLPVFSSHMEQVFTSGVKQTCELWLMLKNKNLLPVIMESILTEPAEGRPVQAHSAMIDISKRKQAEKALSESEERYRSIFQNNHTTMLLIDPESAEIVDANPAACRYYGYTLAELKELKITDINALKREQIFQEMELAKIEQRNHFIFSHRLANGEVRPVEAFSGPIELDGKRLLYSIVHDITERRQAEMNLTQRTKQLEAANKELESFSYSVSHDLRAPLRAIDGYARMILKKEGDRFDEDTAKKV